MTSYPAYRALELLAADRKDRFPSLFSMALDSLSKDEGYEFLAALGRYHAPGAYTYDGLDAIFKRMGKLPGRCLPFAVSTFDFDVKAFDLAEISHKLDHPIFTLVSSPLTHHLLKTLAGRSNSPSLLSPHLVEPLVKVNVSAYEVLNKKTYTNLFKIESERLAPKEPSSGNVLAKIIAEQYTQLSSRFSPPLIALDVTEDDIQLLRQMVQSYLCKAIRDYDLLDFDREWGEGGALFFSALVFSRELEKELSNKFWDDFFQWTGAFEELTRSRTNITTVLRAFVDEREILHQTTLAGDRQYVTTFRMHSIVANRPRSKNLISKFLLRIAKQSGVFYHDEEEQKELLEENLYDDARSIERREVTGDSSTPYLQIPIETAYAYLKNKGQVTEFLLPIYDYVERALIASSEDGIGSGANPEAVPRFLQTAIDGAIEHTSCDDIRSLQELTGSQVLGKVALQYNREQGCLEYVVSSFLFSESDLPPSITFTLTVDGEEVYTREIGHRPIGDDTITDQIVIACDRIPTSVVYSFTAKHDVLKEKTAIVSRIFDLEGNPLVKPGRQTQSVYFLATEDEYIADHHELVHEQILDDYSIYQAKLGEDSPILIGAVLFGIDLRSFEGQAGLFREETDHGNASIQAGSRTYTIIASPPKFWVLDDTADVLEAQLRMIVDNHDAGFAVLQSKATGTEGQSFCIIQPACDFSTIEAGPMHVRIFDSRWKRDLLDHWFFVIRDLRYTFSQPLYYGPSEIHVTSLSCMDKAIVFKSRYEDIPPNLDKFWINPEILKNGRLFIDSPIVDVLVAEKSIFNQGIWYEDIVEQRKIDVKLPSDFTMVSLKTVDSVGTVIHKLTGRAMSYDSTRLQRLPTIDDRFLTLVLDYADASGTLVSCKVCELFCKVTEKEAPEARYFVHADIRLSDSLAGFRIPLRVYSGRARSYVVTVFDPNGRPLESKELSPDGEYTYHQEMRPLRGMYRLEIHEKPKRVFFSRGGEKPILVYSIQVPYKCVLKTSSTDSSVVSNIHGPDIRGFKIIATVRRVQRQGKPTEYLRHLDLPNFYIEGSCTLENNEVFAAEGYFMRKHDRKKRPMKCCNPLTVERRGMLGNAILLRISDCDGSPLRVDTATGHVNDSKSSHSTKVIDCCWFLARLLH